MITRRGCEIWEGVIEDVGDSGCLHMKEREQVKQERYSKAQENDFQEIRGNSAEHGFF